MPNLIVRIDIPALDALVAFLNQQAQGRLDALASEVKALTERLQASGTHLQTSVERENP